MARCIVDEISRYLSQYEKEMAEEFPKAASIVDTPIFMHNLQKQDH